MKRGFRCPPTTTFAANADMTSSASNAFPRTFWFDLPPRVVPQPMLVPAPVEGREGRELFFLKPETSEVAVAEFSTTAESFQRERVTVLFSATEGSLFSVPANRSYDVMPDDERFITIRQAGANVTGELIWVQNFFKELKARVPN